MSLVFGTPAHDNWIALENAVRDGKIDQRHVKSLSQAERKTLMTMLTALDTKNEKGFSAIKQSDAAQLISKLTAPRGHSLAISIGVSALFKKIANTYFKRISSDDLMKLVSPMQAKLQKEDADFKEKLEKQSTNPPDE